MKRKLLLSNHLLAVMFLIMSGIIIMSSMCYAASSKNRLITVMNPAIREELAERINLTPRLKTLEHKTIYLVDMNYEGMNGTPVMGEMQKWFTKNMPNVKTVLKIKAGNYASDDPALWKEIADNGGDGVIMGVAG